MPYAGYRPGPSYWQNLMALAPGLAGTNVPQALGAAGSGQYASPSGQQGLAGQMGPLMLGSFLNYLASTRGGSPGLGPSAGMAQGMGPGAAQAGASMPPVELSALLMNRYGRDQRMDRDKYAMEKYRRQGGRAY